MKIGLFSVFLTLILASNLLLSNTFAQDYTQWELPDVSWCHRATW